MGPAQRNKLKRRDPASSAPVKLKAQNKTPRERKKLSLKGKPTNWQKFLHFSGCAIKRKAFVFLVYLLNFPIFFLLLL